MPENVADKKSTKGPQSMLVAGLVDKLRLEAARIGKGGRLQPVRELTQRHGVSPVTVRNAMRWLEEEGVVDSQVGRGTFVLKNFKANDMTSVKTVSVLREDYPSRRVDEISRKLHRHIIERGNKSLTVTYSDVRYAMDVMAPTPPSDAYVLLAPAPVVPVDLLAFLRKRTPVVILAGASTSGVDIDAIGTDCSYSVKYALDHLVEKGHTRIGFASGEPLQRIQERYSMFCLQMQSRGLEHSDGMAVLAQTEAGESPSPNIRHKFDDLFTACRDRPLPFTALLVWSHASAVGIIESCQRFGVKIPEDLSLVVADCPDLDARFVDTLTMVGRPLSRVVDSLCARIDQRWNDPGLSYEIIREKSELFDRGSVRDLVR